MRSYFAKLFYSHVMAFLGPATKGCAATFSTLTDASTSQTRLRAWTSMLGAVRPRLLGGMPASSPMVLQATHRKLQRLVPAPAPTRGYQVLHPAVATTTRISFGPEDAVTALDSSSTGSQPSSSAVESVAAPTMSISTEPSAPAADMPAAAAASNGTAVATNTSGSTSDATAAAAADSAPAPAAAAAAVGVAPSSSSSSTADSSTPSGAVSAAPAAVAQSGSPAAATAAADSGSDDSSNTAATTPSSSSSAPAAASPSSSPPSPAPGPPAAAAEAADATAATTAAAAAAASGSPPSGSTAAEGPSPPPPPQQQQQGATPQVAEKQEAAGPTLVITRKGLELVSGAAMLPHPDKAHRGGEDSYFIADHNAAVGVADGVGGWAEIGVDAGAYARLLMAHAKDAAEAALVQQPERPLSAQDILEAAYVRTNVQGSSTACVAVLNGSTLAASNVGDSGFVLVRGAKAAFQSPQQQHNFNFPYQLGSAESMSDQPQSAMRFEMTVQPGDMVVMGSDGLWDNVFAEEVALIASRCSAKGETAETTAQVLCRYARMRASDAKYHSPFSYAAMQAGYIYTGGKIDDITVVVSYVSQPSKL